MSDTDEIRPQRTSFLRESGKLSVLTMISRVLGLLREITRTRLLGTTVLAEAFTAAYNTPNLFRKLLAEGAMSTALIPTMQSYFSEGDEERTEQFLSATFTALVWSVGLVVALGMAGAVWIAHAYASMSTDPGVAMDTLETAFLIRLMFPYLAAVSLAAFFQGILNSHGIFVPSGSGPILFNLSFLLIPPMIVFLVPNPARAMAIGVLAGGMLQAAVQLPFVLKLGLRFRLVSLRAAFANPGMKRVLLLMTPTLIGMAVYELNAFVSTGLAYGVGAATSIQLSLRLQELILGVFVVSIGTVLLPELSGAAAREDWQRFIDRFKRSLDAVILVTLPVVVFAILQRTNIVAVLFQTGQFGRESVLVTANIFLFHLFGLIFIAANRIIAPAFYACKDTRNPTYAGMVSFVVNMLSAWLLSLRFGGPGIAVALSLAGAVNTIILVILLLRKNIAGTGTALLAVLGYTGRLLILSGIAAVPIYFIGPLLESALAGHSSRLIFAGVPMVVSALIYCSLGILLLRITRDPIALFLLEALRSRRQRQ